MMLVAAALLFAADPAMGETVRAIQAGRLEQAQIMLNAAIANGTQGEEVHRVRADLAFRSGNFAAALKAYETLAALHPGEPLNFERAGIAAIQLGKLDRAAQVLRTATAFPSASWRAWNARGVLADFQRDWAAADEAYRIAEKLAPERAEVLNNRGWSLMLRGQWTEALPLIERAAGIDPKAARIADNLELVRAAVAQDLPQRRPGESDSDWATRLNDAGVVAASGGERQRAIAAFSQAIEASTHWFERAANNLALVEGKN